MRGVLVLLCTRAHLVWEGTGERAAVESRRQQARVLLEQSGVLQLAPHDAVFSPPAVTLNSVLEAKLGHNTPLQMAQQLARKAKDVDDWVHNDVQRMIKDISAQDTDLVFCDGARPGVHFVHECCRYMTNHGFLDPADLAQQPRSEGVTRRVGAWIAARQAAGSSSSDIDLEKEFAEQLCALRSACQAPNLPQGSTWLVNSLSQKARMCDAQRKLEDCQRAEAKQKEQVLCVLLSPCVRQCACARRALSQC